MSTLCAGDIFMCLVLQVKEIFAVNGGAEALIALLSNSKSNELLVEVAWVLSHASFSPVDANRLGHLGLIKVVAQRINGCLKQVR